MTPRKRVGGVHKHYIRIIFPNSATRLFSVGGNSSFRPNAETSESEHPRASFTSPPKEKEASDY